MYRLAGGRGAHGSASHTPCSGFKHALALEAPAIDIRPRGAYSLRGHSIGGYGSVTVNKLLAPIIGETFGLYVQAYPRYGSEKRGLPTTYYLTIADEPIRQHSELRRVEFVPVHDAGAFGQGDPLAGLVDGGTLFLNSILADPSAIWACVARGRAGRDRWPRDQASSRSTRWHSRNASRRGPTGPPDAGRRARWRVPASRAAGRRTRPAHRRVARRGAAARCSKQLGKRGGAVVEANLELIRAAYEELIDVTAPLRDTGRR